jgi:branched-chain amino acid transport system substrate-binding protein
MRIFGSHPRVRRGALAAAAVLAVGVVAATTAGTAGAKPHATMQLEIGAPMALSGTWAVFDEPLLNGIKEAVKEINGKGGVDGVTVKLDYSDFHGDATQQLASVQQMLDNGVKVFIASNGGSLGSNRLAVTKGAIIAAGSGTDPENTERVGPREYTFVFTDNQQASVGAQYACKKGYRKVWLLNSPDSTYTGNMGAYFADAFAHYCKGKVVGKDNFKIGATDYGSQVTKIQHASTKPDVIFSSIFVPDSGSFLKALRSAGVKTPFITTDGNDSPLFAKSGGNAVNGAIFTTHGFPTPGSAMAQFVANYKRLMGKAPETNTIEAIGRDNVYGLVYAAAKAKSTDPDKILAALATLKGVKLATGTITMDPKTRTPIKPITIVKMVGSKPTFVAAITPKYTPKSIH